MARNFFYWRKAPHLEPERRHARAFSAWPYLALATIVGIGGVVFSNTQHSATIAAAAVDLPRRLTLTAMSPTKADPSLLTTLAEQRTTIARLQARVSGSEQEAGQLRQRIASLQQQLETLQGTARQSSDEISKLRTDISRRDAEVTVRMSTAIAPSPPPTPNAPIERSQPQADKPQLREASPRETRTLDNVPAVVTSNLACTGSRPAAMPELVLQFDRYKDSLNTSHHKSLADVTDAALRCAGMRLEIKGFSDGRGNPALKQQLSQRRAELTAKFFEAHGIRTDQLDVLAMSDRDPVASNDTDAGRALNRRVEIRLKLAK